MLYTLLQVVTLIFTLESAIFLIRGNLRLTPQSIAGLSTTHVGFNPHLVQSLARQKADTAVATILLLIGFLTQIVTLWRGPTYDDLGAADRTGLITGILISILAFFVAHYCSMALSKRLVGQVEGAVNTKLSTHA
jgi:uncharacterized membrane protein